VELAADTTHNPRNGSQGHHNIRKPRSNETQPNRDHNSNGKRAAELNANYLAPRTPLEAVVAGVWQDVLGVREIGVRDNFFEMGGHSLLITTLISRLNHMFKVDLPALSLFESPTVADLAVCIETIFQINRDLAAPPEQ
jgi:hypothetical protein